MPFNFSLAFALHAHGCLPLAPLPPSPRQAPLPWIIMARVDTSRRSTRKATPSQPADDSDRSQRSLAFLQRPLLPLSLSLSPSRSLLHEGHMCVTRRAPTSVRCGGPRGACTPEWKYVMTLPLFGVRPQAARDQPRRTSTRDHLSHQPRPNPRKCRE